MVAGLMRSAVFLLCVVVCSFAQQTKQGNQSSEAWLGPIKVKPIITVRGKTIIESPKQDQILKKDTVHVFIRTEGGSGDSSQNRFHVFLDQESPKLHENEKKPFTLEKLSEGGHVLRVVAIQPDGKAEALPDSYAVVRFFVKKKNLKNFADLRKPYITVNLPADGMAALDDQKCVCMDFLVHNAKVGPKNYNVRYRLDHSETIVDSIAPIYWSDLAPGKHSLTVELVNPSGNAVLGLFSKVQREFEIAPVLEPLPVTPEDEEDSEFPSNL